MTLLEVIPPPHGTVLSIAPCAFRNAVARAHRELQEGHRLRFLGLDEGECPSIDVAVPRGGEIAPGGIYRVPCGDGAIHAFATTLDPRACRAILRDVTGDLFDVATGPGPLSVDHDAGIDVTLVSALRGRDASDDVPGTLREVMVRCAGEELGRELLGAHHRPASR